MAKRKTRILIFDCETDPFLHGRKPAPFLAGYFDGVQFVQFWGDDCMAQFCDYIRDQPKAIIYAHNGGKFDFFFFPWPLDNPKIINGRIAKATHGNHELRDSYCILPFALSKFEKTKIDYSVMERDEREKHKPEIMQYHRDDLLNTWEMVTAFRERFGNKLTVAGAAINELNKIHPIERKDENHDAVFRPYLFGGRVEAIRAGNHPGKWKVYDVNSMYPFCMKEFSHPLGREYEFTTDKNKLLRSKAPGFAILDCFSGGAFPIREGFKLQFPHRHDIYYVTLHEFRTAHELGLVKNVNVLSGHLAKEYGSFGAFVDKFVSEKIAAKISGDKLGEIFAKLMLNSAYGKLAANPENYYDYQFILESENIPFGWEIDEDHGWMLVIRRPSTIRFNSYYDVATGASITGAARSILLRAIHTAREAIYCDTDSIICKSLGGIVSDTALGQWKLEAQGDNAFIVGRKCYAITQNGEIVKSASKGVQMQGKDFLALLKNGEYKYIRDAPNFKKDGSVKFTQRTVTYARGEK